MGTFKYIPPREVEERHRSKRPTASPRGALPSQSEPRQRNVEAVLSLGSTRYLRLHDRAYAIPPVSFTLGQRLLDRSIQVTVLAKRLSITGKREDSVEYYLQLSSLAQMMWPYMTPTGGRKWLKRFHLMRNPLLVASEFEIKDVCDFFLQGRTRSSVQPLSDQTPAYEIQTS